VSLFVFVLVFFLLSFSFSLSLSVINRFPSLPFTVFVFPPYCHLGLGDLERQRNGGDQEGSSGGKEIKGGKNEKGGWVSRLKKRMKIF